MEQRLKQRLIGAIVLVALAVIVIPMFLQSAPERESTAIPAAIPPQPKVEQKPPAVTADDSASDRIQQPVPSSWPESTEPPPKTEVESLAKPEAAPPAQDEPSRQSPTTPPDLAAWAVQVGSFGNRDNALRLRDSLRDKGYTAYTESTRSKGKTFYRVRIGPTSERTQAEQLQAALRDKESLEGVVVSHP